MSGDCYSGLVLSTSHDVAWKWIGYRIIEGVRAERWEAPCRTCGALFTVLAKLPGGLRQRFREARNRALEARKAIDVRLSMPTGRPIRALRLRNCKAHREAAR
jgi:hypothetical protein